MSDVQSVIDKITGEIFQLFQSIYDAPKGGYDLNEEAVSNAVNNAFTDLARVSDYHSEKGADLYRQTAYVVKWISVAKPVVVSTYPVNSTSVYNLNLQRVNAAFSAFCVSIFLADDKMISEDLVRELRYIFEFRYATPPDSLATLFKHCESES